MNTRITIEVMREDGRPASNEELLRGMLWAATEVTAVGGDQGRRQVTCPTHLRLHYVVQELTS